MSQRDFKVISILNTSATLDVKFGTASPLHIMEYTTWYIPPTLQLVPATGRVPLWPSGKHRADVLGPLVYSKGKRTIKRKMNEKEMTTSLVLDNDEDSETKTLLPPYIPPRWEEAMKVKIPTKIQALLVAPKLLKGIKVWKKIMPNLQKLSFDNHDTNNLSTLDRNSYMDLVKETPNLPNHFVAKEWVKGLDQYSIL